MSFNPFSAEWFADPTELYRTLRDEAPLYRNDELDFYALSRFDDVVAALRDWQTFASGHGISLSELADPDFDNTGNMLSMDPPEHDALRRIVSRSFTPRSVGAFRPSVEKVIDAFLEPLIGRTSFDAVADFAGPFPVEVISTILGVPEERRQWTRHQLDVMQHRNDGDPRIPEAGMQAAIELGTYFYALAEERQGQPGDDMISELVHARVADDDGNETALTTLDIAGFTSLLGGAGTETVTKLLGNAFVLFHRNPDQWAKVVADPARIPDAIEEALRWAPPAQYVARRTTAAVDVAGGTIPAGANVLLLIGSATRDERAYPDADAFDIDREQRLAIGFGYGIHSCLGAALARLEGRVALERFAEHFPRFRVVEDGLRRVTMENVAGYCNVPVTA